MKIKKELSFRKEPVAIPAVKAVASSRSVHFFRLWSGDFSLESWVSDFELFIDQQGESEERTRVTHLGIDLAYPTEERYYELRQALEAWLNLRLPKRDDGLLVEWTTLFEKEGLYYFFSFGHGSLWGLTSFDAHGLWAQQHFLLPFYPLPRIALGISDVSQGSLLRLSRHQYSALSWQVGTGPCSSDDWRQGEEHFFSAQVSRSSSPYFYLCVLDLSPSS